MVRVPQVECRVELPGGILLTGSANLALMEVVSESLAGRAGYVFLPPFCPGEWLGDLSLLQAMDLLFAKDFDPRDWPTGQSDWDGWAVRGGYSGVLAMDSAEARDIWFEGYVATYLERDLRQMLEQLVFQNLQAWAACGARRSISYWRDGAREVDFVIEQGDELVAIEVKSATSLSGSDFNGLRAFQSTFTKRGRQPPPGILLSPATMPLSFEEHLYSLPLHPFAPPPKVIAVNPNGADGLFEGNLAFETPSLKTDDLQRVEVRSVELSLTLSQLRLKVGESQT